MSSKRGRVDLLLPGLLHVPAHDIDLNILRSETPALYRLLRCANRVNTPSRDFDDIISELLGNPAAGLAYAHTCDAQSEKPALLFKPVFLKADINNAIVFPLDENNPDILNIINDLQDYFKEDFDVETVSENLWLMRLHHCQPRLDTPHYLNAVGKKVTQYLEQARSNLEWFKLFNEIQMFLYQHPLNQQRLQNGQMLVNSLWCWGSGQPVSSNRQFSSWLADETELQQLGKLYANRVGELSSDIEFSASQSNLLLDVSVLKALKTGSAENLMAQLQRIETTYLARLFKQPFQTIHLHTGDGIDFVYRPSHSWRFWRSLAWDFLDTAYTQ